MKAFSETVENKFKDLLEVNSAKTKELKRRLVQNASNIDQYITMKHFLEGAELRNMILEIQNDLALCKSIYEFMTECKIKSEDTLL